LVGIQAGSGDRAGRPQHDAGRSTCTGGIGCTILTAVGLNPFRQQRRSPADILMVAGALLVCVALVAWALFG
jgi:hypothetical protein